MTALGAEERGMSVKPTKGITNSLPDLESMVDAFWDAVALVVTAHAVIVESDTGYGEEESVLRQGCEALERVGDQLEDAQLQFARCRTNHGGTQDAVERKDHVQKKAPRSVVQRRPTSPERGRS